MTRARSLWVGDTAPLEALSALAAIVQGAALPVAALAAPGAPDAMAATWAWVYVAVGVAQALALARDWAGARRAAAMAAWMLWVFTALLGLLDGSAGVGAPLGCALAAAASDVRGPRGAGA